MQLTELVASEAGLPVESLMLLRHSNESTRFLTECGASIEEYTAIQPRGSKYDYFRDPDRPIAGVIVIVEDHVYGVFRIAGIVRSGTNFEVASPEYVEFDRRRNKASRDCHYFRLEQISVSAVGRHVRGWENRTRTPVQRFGDSFFMQIEVDDPVQTVSVESLRSQHQLQVSAGLRLTSAERRIQLQESNAPPARVAVLGYEYLRNPLVVAEVLHRAQGLCERCRNPAPFRRKTDGTPYLEVHHRIPLAAGGLDTVNNAEALCPNCHRHAHYGDA